MQIFRGTIFTPIILKLFAPLRMSLNHYSVESFVNKIRVRLILWKHKGISIAICNNAKSVLLSEYKKDPFEETGVSIRR